jgi:hypothetical protein
MLNIAMSDSLLKKVLMLAGIYNIAWGIWVIFFPKHIFHITSMPIPDYLEFWQCIGMIVGVYGLGYLIAAKDFYRHWPIILVGFLGKIFGPIGFFQALITERFPLSFGMNIIANDLVWWYPFGLILYRVYQKSK